MAAIPATMRSLVAPKKCNPDGYEVIDMPTPKITKPNEVLLKVRAAGTTTGDTQFATGMGEIIAKPEYPMKIAIEGSGVVAAVGSGVKNVKVGDAVYGFNLDKPFPKDRHSGFASEYTVIEERFILPKPPQLSFEEAAALPGHTITVMQTIRRGLQLGGQGNSLEGKTVFIPGALSATGSLAVQVAKNVYGASKIISTVSTVKMPLVEQRLPGIVDQLVDYQKQDVPKEVGRGTVDFSLNTQWGSFNDSLAVTKRDGSGVLMSIASVPPKSTLKSMFGDGVPFWLGLVLNLAQVYYWWKLLGTGVKYEFLSGSPNIREDMEAAGEVVARGQVKPVMTIVELEDIDEVRKACEKLRSGKGGLGKLVIRVSKE